MIESESEPTTRDIAATADAAKLNTSPEGPITITANGDDVPVDKFAALFANPDVRQFVKFCLVGASSTVVNLVVLHILYYNLKTTLFVALAGAFFLSVLNGFFFNRRWTFKEKRGRSRQTQYLRFTLVNLVGFTLSTTIVATVISIATPDLHHAGGVGHFLEVAQTMITPGTSKKSFPMMLTYGAQIIAIGFVVFWNYFANKYWTFKH